MEMMERREALGEARAQRDSGAVARLASEIRAREKAVMERLSEGFAREGATGLEIEKLVPLLGELRYYRRFLDEVSAIEEAT
jgi:molecular chaperone HscB